MKNFEERVVELLEEIATSLRSKPVPELRFMENGDETISDKKTGLMWAKGMGPESMPWEKAKDYCEKLNLGGHNDWRLPTVEELLTLVDYSNVSPAINPVFKTQEAYHWTSTPYAGDTDDRWIVGFGNGYTDWSHQSGSSYVRPVRQY